MLELFTYPFFQRALLAAILISIGCGIVGTYIVSRRIVFIAGGISHASFGGIGIGYFYGIHPIIGAALFAVMSALSVEIMSKRAKMRIDSLIGIIWSFGMAIGILFIYITPGYAPDLMSYLFGSILTVSQSYIIIITILCTVTILFFYIFYKDILFISFDEEYARTQKMPVKIINYCLISLVALTVVITIRIVGLILVISLLTIPQMTASLFTHDFKKIIFSSIVLGFIACFTGLLGAHYFKIPSGATIIFCSVFIFTVGKLINIYIQKSKTLQ